MLRYWLLILGLAVAATGCKHRSWAPYVAPRVSGRVVDAETAQPIGQVKIYRNQTRPDPTAKPAERMLEPDPARSNAEGRFEMASEKTFSPFRGGWSSVSLRFMHPDYVPFTTNFSLALSTNLPSGEPWVNTGDIPLAPKPASRPVQR